MNQNNNLSTTSTKATTAGTSQDIKQGPQDLPQDKNVWQFIEDFLREFRIKMVKPVKIPVYWGNPFKKNRY